MYQGWIVFAVYTECEVNRCENGGTCVKLAASYMCNCADDYAGTLCEVFSKKILYLHYVLCISIAV